MLLAASAATPIPTRIPLIVRIAVHKLCSSAIIIAVPDTAVSPFVLCNRPPEYSAAQLSPNRAASAAATLRPAQGSNRVAHQASGSQSPVLGQFGFPQAALAFSIVQ